MKKHLFIYLVLLSLLGIFCFFCHEKTEGFQAHKIVVLDLPRELPRVAREENLSFLQQKFFYLGRGRQSFVFSSEDGNFVIKFLRYHKYQKPLSVRMFSSFLTKDQKQALLEKKERSLRAQESYDIAFRTLKEETAVIFAHLTPTRHLCRQIEVYDGLNKKWTIELDNVLFIVQKKAVSLEKALREAFLAKEEKRVKSLIFSFLDGVLSRQKQGILNRDWRNALRNSGVIGDQVIEVDIGSFYRDDAIFSGKRFEEEIVLFSTPLREFLEKNENGYLPMFYERIGFLTKAFKLEKASNEDL
jgi:hypothetical protein